MLLELGDSNFCWITQICCFYYRKFIRDWYLKLFTKFSKKLLNSLDSFKLLVITVFFSFMLICVGVLFLSERNGFVFQNVFISHIFNVKSFIVFFLSLCTAYCKFFFLFLKNFKLFWFFNIYFRVETCALLWL